jgi:hypothetical protein
VAANDPIYESDPDSRPDANFVPADLDRLVVGNRGRLLDARRTPVTLIDVRPERGAFVVRVDAFEDAGATWELFLGELKRFQFERNATQATERQVGQLRQSLERFDRELLIRCTTSDRDASFKELGRRRRLVRDQFGVRLEAGGADAEQSIARREGRQQLFELTEEFLDEHGLASIERHLLVPLISNPRSGEAVKGHAIVLAELGLCPYQGQIIRDPDLFAGGRSKEVRSDHLLWRMALTQELWSPIGPVPVFRAAANDEELRPAANPSFVSATFSSAVAESHFEGGPSTSAAVLMRQDLPLERLLMTFLETRAMNDRFHEAEALLVGSDSPTAF